MKGTKKRIIFVPLQNTVLYLPIVASLETSQQLISQGRVVLAEELDF
jgi:hypothetical protein